MKGQERRELRRKAQKKDKNVSLEEQVNTHRFTKLAEKAGKVGAIIGYAAMILVLFRLAAWMGVL